MEDRFEKFIMENRGQFDTREPDPRIWDKIERDIRVSSKFNWKVGFKRAAIVLLILMASYGAFEMINRVSSGSDMAVKGKKYQKENTLPGLKEAEAYYTNIVNEKLNELKPIIANCPSLEEEIQFDLSELDSVYVDLKKDLKDNMANQEVIEAIIDNYRLKISILEDLRNELAEMGDECIPLKTEQYAL
ncbi:MAG: hypothetical protein JXQ80_08075 [Bacteroidales bacterium]|nr:hypothetical protein [Bacteroidales bacterium]